MFDIQRRAQVLFRKGERSLDAIGFRVELEHCRVLGLAAGTPMMNDHHLGSSTSDMFAHVPIDEAIVAAASGPVGSLVGQLARLVGARAVGIAGGEAKCAYVRNQLRFDAAIDHRAAGFSHALAEACPDGIDVYFENVGGEVWTAVLPLLNRYARVPVCGLIAHYNDAQSSRATSVAETMLTVLRRSVLIKGFINTEFAAEYYESFLNELTPLVRSGDIRYREDVAEGLEAAPRAFIDMLSGRNFGKTLVHVS